MFLYVCVCLKIDLIKIIRYNAQCTSYNVLTIITLLRYYYIIDYNHWLHIISLVHLLPSG